MFRSSKYFKPVLCASLLLLVSACGATKKSKTKVASGVTTEEKNIDTYNNCSSEENIAVTHFDFDSSEVLSGSQKIISDHVAECVKTTLAKNPEKKVLITGYCDKRGTKEYNIALGSRRADATKTYLVDELKSLVQSDCSECPSAENVDFENMYNNSMCTASRGKEDLVDNGDTEAAHAKNRRTVIEIVDECN